MSKRKAGVNDIIYELDNDDIEISSEDEAKDAKIHRLDEDILKKVVEITQKEDECKLETVTINLTDEETEEVSTEAHPQNGGKSSPDESRSEDNINLSEDEISILETENDIESAKINLSEDDISIQETESDSKIKSDCSKTTIFNEDIVIDSPTSNSDLGVVGCENRTPLVTVRFRDKKLAASYKKKLKTFMLNLIKLHDENATDVESETDIELDIWPEDLNDDDDFGDTTGNKEDDNLFFIDTAPCSDLIEVPTYKQVLNVISNTPKKEPSPPPTATRRLPSCFNCDGPHPLRECTLPRNNSRIAEKRRTMTRVGRYHVEDEQKYGHLIPGRISGQLRHALGLKRNELPLYIYRMRMLGYPPGWLEEARISHSGITMFDSTGTAIQDPEDEDGEVCEPGSKDKFDIKKILDFPGFNVPASSRYKEEAHLYGLPPMSEQDSKIKMLQMLAPNAMKAYKRKKLTIFPSSNPNATTTEIAEMELDSGDEVAEFPSVPPLPDEAPPPPPPPPPPESPDPPPPGVNDSADDLQVVEVTEVKDIPVPEPELITIDDDDQKSPDTENTQPDDIISCQSPTLDDLEEKKRLLLSALKNQNDDLESVNLEEDNTADDSSQKCLDDTEKLDANDDKDKPKSPIAVEQIDEPPVRRDSNISLNNSTSTIPPEQKAGMVKTTLYGTPVMNIASPYVKLPSDDKFAKDICDVINFENLPNSTGKYKQISSLLKKVKSEVDRIQES